MYARVARFEGAAPGALKRIGDELSSGPREPPPGVPATGFLMLAGEDGSSLSIVLFETEEDLRTGDAALEKMTPSEDGGHRVALDTYEVAVDLRL